MRRGVIGFVLGAAVVAASVLAINGLLTAINKSKCKRFSADLQSVGIALREFRERESAYPSGLTVDDLAASLEPEFMRRVPTFGISYFSDGESYVLFSRWGEAGPSTCGCFYEMRDGEFVTWPKAVFSERPEGVPAI